MAKHKVQVSMPERPVGRCDVQFDVWGNDTKLGTLTISRGGIDWTPAGKRWEHPHVLGWEKLIKLIEENVPRK